MQVSSELKLPADVTQPPTRNVRNVGSVASPVRRRYLEAQSEIDVSSRP